MSRNREKRNRLLIKVYFVVMIAMLITVSAVPWLIGHKITLGADIVIEEEILETGLICILFGISYVIWRSFRRRLIAYQLAILRSGLEKSQLMSRMVDAFKYIGSVNVELDETMNILCGATDYPLTKKALKQQLHCMTSRIMNIAGVPWAILRIIDRINGHTVKEFAFEHTPGTLPSAPIGNRAILEGDCCEKLKIINTCQKNLKLHTVLILPAVHLTDETHTVIRAILNQMEMLFLLFYSDGLQPFKASEPPNIPELSQITEQSPK